MLKKYLISTLFLSFLLSSLLFSQTTSETPPSRKYYDQREFNFLNEYNSMVWKYLRAIDEIKDGHYKSGLKYGTDRNGKITSLIPNVDNSLFTGQSILRTLSDERRALTKLTFDDNTNRLAENFLRAVQNAQEGVDEIIKFYSTTWSRQTEAQAGEVQKQGGWTKVWESMRDIVTKSRSFFNAIGHSDDPKDMYVDAKVVADMLPPVFHLPPTSPGSPMIGFWYKVGEKTITVSEPIVDNSPFKADDVILGVYRFGAITKRDSSLDDAELDPSMGAEKTLIEFPTIIQFDKTFNGRMHLVGKSLRFLIRREGREMKVDVTCSAAEGGNIFEQ